MFNNNFSNFYFINNLIFFENELNLNISKFSIIVNIEKDFLNKQAKLIQEFNLKKYLKNQLKLI